MDFWVLQLTQVLYLEDFREYFPSMKVSTGFGWKYNYLEGWDAARWEASVLQYSSVLNGLLKNKEGRFLYWLTS